MADSSAVDFITLKEFHDNLAARLEEAQDVVRRVDSHATSPLPNTGDFSDGRDTADAYQRRWTDQTTRAHLLLAAVQAAYDATGSILETYKTVEELNHANTLDVLRQLESVGDPLKGTTNV